MKDGVEDAVEDEVLRGIADALKRQSLADLLQGRPDVGGYGQETSVPKIRVLVEEVKDLQRACLMPRG